MTIIDTIKSKIPFLKKEAEDEFSEDLGGDLEDLGDVPSPEAEPEPLPGESGFENPPPEEYQQPEPELSPEPPQPQYQAQPAPQAQPPYQQPSPQFPDQQPPAQPGVEKADLENIKLNMDNIKQRIENIMHRFDTLASELDSIKSESAYEKTVLSKYDY